MDVISKPTKQTDIVLNKEPRPGKTAAPAELPVPLRPATLYQDCLLTTEDYEHFYSQGEMYLLGISGSWNGIKVAPKKVCMNTRWPSPEHLSI